MSVILLLWASIQQTPHLEVQVRDSRNLLQTNRFHSAMQVMHGNDGTGLARRKFTDVSRDGCAHTV